MSKQQKCISCHLSSFKGSHCWFLDIKENAKILLGRKLLSLAPGQSQACWEAVSARRGDHGSWHQAGTSWHSLHPSRSWFAQPWATGPCLAPGTVPWPPCPLQGVSARAAVLPVCAPATWLERAVATRQQAEAMKGGSLQDNAFPPSCSQF